MTQGRRILINVVATYGRSLYSLAIGLLCGRWTLMALGQVDYGLFGLVGGFTGFVGFVNDLLSMSVGRFYAVAVGAARKTNNSTDGIENSCKWFNTAFALHSVVPLVLLVVGYPIGEWGIRNFLTIPAERIAACLWVWRFTCGTCFMGMVSVPFNAMYVAKQEIAELTIYSFITSTLNVLAVYYMITHPRAWLVRYAMWTMLLSIAPQVIITWRAIVKFPECRIRFAYLFDKRRVLDVVNFAFARFWTALSSLVTAQGNAILVNKYLGPAFNASMAIGNTVAGHASRLSSSLSGAFWPAIANKAGEGDEEGVREFAFRTCRIGTCLLLLFAIPLALEIDEVMILWLKTPPVFVSIIAVAILADMVLERMSEGYWMAIMGMGRRVGFYSACVSVAGFARLTLTWTAFAMGYGIYGLCVALVLSRCITIAIRLKLGHLLVGMSRCHWLRTVCIPLMSVVAVTSFLGYSVRFFVEESSFFRVCLTTIMCEIIFLPLCWLLVLSVEERHMVARKVVDKLSRSMLGQAFRHVKSDR